MRTAHDFWLHKQVIICLHVYRAINRTALFGIRCGLFSLFFFFLSSSGSCWNEKYLILLDNHQIYIYEINSHSNRKSILRKINYLQLPFGYFWLVFILASWWKVGSSSHFSFGVEWVWVFFCFCFWQTFAVLFTANVFVFEIFPSRLLIETNYWWRFISHSSLNSTHISE